MLGRRVAVHCVTAGHDLLARLEVQRAVEVRGAPPRIHGQDDDVGCILGRIDQFFAI
jgi:hypothetical protein